MNKLNKENFQDIKILNGKIMNVKAGSKGLCTVRIESITELEKLYRIRFTYLICSKEIMPSEQEIMMVPKEMFLKDEIYYWETWSEYAEENL